ncbi:hypothetical protein OIU85_000826 [Salix viminalis]|uniref:Uncharacterized protein n=1 Tax=Salix viminalis TaxID=40686 RepID=A0A9Q0VKE9_SALVM|nr:hypothetical protein OIU85_000826 [Salix viminalis]
MENPNEATHGSKLAAVVNATECLVAGASSSKAIINNFVKNLTLSSIKKKEAELPCSLGCLQRTTVVGTKRIFTSGRFSFCCHWDWDWDFKVSSRCQSWYEPPQKVSDLSCELGPM